MSAAAVTLVTAHLRHIRTLQAPRNRRASAAGHPGAMETFPPALRRPDLVDLADDGAIDGSLVGAKAANLARARRAGLPVLPGRRAHHRLGPPRLVAPLALPSTARPAPPGRRSATSGERTARGPLVVHQRGRRLVVDGRRVQVGARRRDLAELRRRRRPGARLAARADVPDARMAVLVQPQLAPRWGGVLFGADPVSGRTDRLLLAAVEGGPDRLVSGLDDGWTAVLSPRGRVLEDRGRRRAARSADGAAGAGRPGRAGQRGLRRPAGHRVGHRPRRHAVAAAEPPDHHADRPTRRPGARHRPAGRDVPRAAQHPRVRPVARPARRGPGAGPAAHRHRLAAGALRRSPVVRDIDGWAVADLGHLGVAPVRHKLLRKLDPRPPARRLRAAWRTGRLTRALPSLARDVVEQVDARPGRGPPHGRAVERRPAGRARQRAHRPAGPARLRGPGRDARARHRRGRHRGLAGPGRPGRGPGRGRRPRRPRRDRTPSCSPWPRPGSASAGTHRRRPP